ncbi:MAG: thiamine pyrophosphate-dependent enzyme [Ardenticatenaceae bacterium]|nr:thiamine pyrophosphate-dependent enzyme [Ardenticatenaceae bacterium]HBY93172.1 phosphonopyruvate decarboxylase [Chloroflexota bacterium]
MLARIEALRTLVTALPDWPVVVTCGLTSREVASLGVRPNHLYVLNSMGLAGPIGMGLALGLGRKTLVIEGDGGLLMGLSFLATVGDASPSGLVLAILDNGAYCSTGCQPTAARTVDLGRLAAAAGWTVFTSSTGEELSQTIAHAVAVRRPVLLHIPIDTTATPGVPYFQPDPPALTAGFCAWLEAATSQHARSDSE